MDPAQAKLIETLNRLARQCISAEETYHQAAQQIQDFELTALLSDCARVHSHMADELQNLVQALGGRPENRGTAGGNFRRRWLQIRQMVAPPSDATLLSHCRRGQQSIVEAFRRVLLDPLPAEPDSTLRRHFSTMVATCERLKSLEQYLATH